MTADEPLDLISLGRCCVDLYAEQEGAPLEQVQSFRTYVGGSGANIAVGTARLGLRTAMLSRVGDEQLGRFVRAQLRRAGVDTRWLATDPARLTPLVLLAVRAVDDFPRIFYYPDPADLAVDEADVAAAPIERARALLVGGSALSRPGMRQAAEHAVKRAVDAGARVALDLDFRPVLWGLASASEGGRMAGGGAEVPAAYERVLAGCALVVGTEEEFRAVGGEADTVAALRAVRERTGALLVVKHGAAGATAVDGAVPGDLGDAVRGRGFPVEVFNSVGAGDAFMSGFLRAWLDDEPLGRCLELGNACGALVVSRHGCSPAMPTAAEVEHFLPRAASLSRPGEDDWLSHLHRATTRPRREELEVLAIDHRRQLEDAADAVGAPRSALPALKDLLAAAFLEVAADHPASAGVLLDDVYGAAALERLAAEDVWVGRAAEVAGSRPVHLAGGDGVDVVLRAWPPSQVAKLMVYAHPDDDAAMWEEQRRRVRQLAEACQRLDRGLLLELQTPAGATYRDGELVAVLERFYADGVRPDWWKLPPLPRAADWRAVGDVVRAHDPWCQGVLVLGQAAGAAQLRDAFRIAAAEPLCRGFAVGRSIFADAARAWLAGESDDARLVADVAANYRAIAAHWDDRRS